MIDLDLLSPYPSRVVLDSRYPPLRMTPRSSIELAELPAGVPTPSSTSSIRPDSKGGTGSVASAGIADGTDGNREDQSTRLQRLSFSKGEEQASSLALVDRGRGAWTYVVAATVLE